MADELNDSAFQYWKPSLMALRYSSPENSRREHPALNLASIYCFLVSMNWFFFVRCRSESPKTSLPKLWMPTDYVQDINQHLMRQFTKGDK